MNSLAPARAVIERLAEIQSVPDAAAIIHRQHDVSLARQILIHRVRVVVVVHVMPAEQHLPPRPAVQEHQRRHVSPPPRRRRQKQLRRESASRPSPDRSPARGPPGRPPGNPPESSPAPVRGRPSPTAPSPAPDASHRRAETRRRPSPAPATTPNAVAARHRRRRRPPARSPARCAAGRYRRAPGSTSRRSRSRPAEYVTCSTSKSPGVSSVAVPPSIGAE